MPNKCSKHFMYVLQCADDTLYTGYTIDIEARVKAHNLGKGAKYTSTRTPVTLLAFAKFSNKHNAMSAEFKFKRLSRKQKLLIINKSKDSNSFKAQLIELFNIDE